MEFDIVHKFLGLTLLGSQWILWLLIGLSVLSVAIVIERVIFFARMKLDFPEFMHELVAHLGQNDTAGAQKLCEQSNSLEAQVALRGFMHQGKGPKAMGDSMSAYLIGERQILDRGLMVLGTLGNNAPFIGLFGTVIGIIKAFHELSMNPAGGPSVVMTGISEALVATAIGLLVAIPAVIAFNTFQRIVKRRLANAESVMRIILAHNES